MTLHKSNVPIFQLFAKYFMKKHHLSMNFKLFEYKNMLNNIFFVLFTCHFA